MEDKNIITVKLLEETEEVGNFKTIIEGDNKQVASALVCIFLNLMDNKKYDIIRQALTYVSNEMNEENSNDVA